MILEYNDFGQLISTIDGQRVCWSVGVEHPDYGKNIVNVYGEDSQGTMYSGYARDNLDGTYEIINHTEI
jgi:hypothetical protein